MELINEIPGALVKLYAHGFGPKEILKQNWEGTWLRGAAPSGRSCFSCLLTPEQMNFLPENAAVNL